MSETEGVFKFELKHTPAPPVAVGAIRELNAWRTILHRLGLIGQECGRYGGLGFGNVSQRLAEKDFHALFVISGTQTGAKAKISAEDYAVVVEACPKQNLIRSRGPALPSSEALTHAAVYLTDERVGSVMHVHCPEIWRRAEAWKLPATGKRVAYGTPEMAQAVTALFDSGAMEKTPIFAMLGHEDGILSFGPTPESAAQVLIRHLARAYCETETLDNEEEACPRFDAG